MAANDTPRFPLTVQSFGIKVVNADGTSEKTVATAGANGLRIDTLSITSDDTVSRTFSVYTNDGATSYHRGEVVVPAGSGTDGSTLSVNLLSKAILPWLNKSGSIFLKAGWKLNIAAKVAATAGKTITFAGDGGDY